MTDALGIFVTVLGFVPMLISAIEVEKNRTQTWEEFWNIYGLILVCLGIIISSGGIFDVLILLALIILLIIFVIYVFKEGSPEDQTGRLK